MPDDAPVTSTVFLVMGLLLVPLERRWPDSVT
jgi:hypothetical protein